MESERISAEKVDRVRDRSAPAPAPYGRESSEGGGVVRRQALGGLISRAANSNGPPSVSGTTGSGSSERIRRSAVASDSASNDRNEASASSGRFVVGAATDPAEAAADRFADRIADAQESKVRRSMMPAPGGDTIGAGGGLLDSSSSALLRSRLGAGCPLDPLVRRQFETTGGRHLGSVRVHHDDHAASLARQMSASAFTVGSDIFMGRGNYRPDSADGQRLLAHEVGHVVADGDNGVRRHVIRRAIGFEFETNVVVRKNATIGYKKLPKMAKIATTPLGISVEADENSQLGSTIEFVVPHLDEDKRSELDKQMTELETTLDVMADSQTFPKFDNNIKIKGKDSAEQNANAKKQYDKKYNTKGEKIDRVFTGAKKDVFFFPPGKNIVSNPQVTAGIAASKMHSAMGQVGGATGAPKGGKSLESGTTISASAATVNGLQVNGAAASDELKGFAANLIAYLKVGDNMTAPLNYAKLISGGMMIRTDFATWFGLLPTNEKTALQLNGGQDLVDLILQQAGLNGTGNQAVFKRGIRKSQDPTSKNYNKTLDFMNFTRTQWLAGIANGTDLLSAKRAKIAGEKKVTAELEGLGRLGDARDQVGNQTTDAAATGVIVEFRQMGKNVYYKDWKQLALETFDFIVATNAGVN